MLALATRSAQHLHINQARTNAPPAPLLVVRVQDLVMMFALPAMQATISLALHVYLAIVIAHRALDQLRTSVRIATPVDF